MGLKLQRNSSEIGVPGSQYKARNSYKRDSHEDKLA